MSALHKPLEMRREPALVPEGWCEAARIGAALGVTLAREDELDRAGLAGPKDDGTAELYRNTQQLHVFDQTQALRAALACHPAKSVEGCIYQLGEALYRLDAVYRAGKDPDSFTVGEDYRAACRCLYSVTGFLGTLAGTDDLPGLDSLMPGSQNPWFRVEDRVQALRARQGKARS